MVAEESGGGISMVQTMGLKSQRILHRSIGSISQSHIPSCTTAYAAADLIDGLLRSVLDLYKRSADATRKKQRS